MDPQRINYLLEQYTAGQLSPAEEQEWENLIEKEEHRSAFQDFLLEQLAATPAGNASTDPRWQGIYQQVFSIDKPQPVRRLPLLKYWTRAALILLLLGVAFYGWLHWRSTCLQRKTPPATTPAVPQDRQPGKNNNLERRTP
ncbi:MAG: hypothetical protein P0Y53_19975 [Candidatus Pseudobacter hemicellulosilyticus]|uniref:Uncharacterized protein n=1 Tax=Candidatus Pseudobacter hemicellulosilyticus TaxID=3121375 RepID=A0AAJ5WPX6_9BACT|nr:MAG: hypothetical protein P0Y53_19975 [Pseudobacter sp.]